ncbi:MAG: SDR family NAD(P)-dependent oxidoreductase [Firmicutes bacterium]|nr:SDR family NAD(P)-dependent oxidoreductase [Bacillota bacterium]
MTKTAYVTGADRGLGFWLAAGLLERGYNVFAGSYLPDYKELSTLSDKYGNSLNILPLDISNTNSVNGAATQIAKKTDYLNLLINNAGIATVHDKEITIFDDIDYDEILKMYNINTIGTLRVTKSVLSLLLKSQDKRLVNITSLAGSIKLLTRTNQYAYVMSKAASNIQTKLLYNSLNEKGVKVFAIHPGWMHSSLFDNNPDLMKGATFEPEDAANLILNFVLTANNDNDHIFFNNDGTTLEY